ncbi:MAG: aldo/keto reductase [Deltaproteobacteria bacterium]|nr:aldo/keto reductase [Sandaracinaceae bacterium]MCX7808035.1 aldo/keto reductase [Deltaproteobacteria bacterium]MDW8246797.1 aldo/keto reductase [Sandaracinaceae bacterium]
MQTLPQRQLGPTGRMVSAIGLGAMPMSLAGRPPESQSIAVIRRALELGVTLIDTADVYCLDDSDIGHNERLIARALAEAGQSAKGVVVATKGGLRRPRGEWVVDARPERLREACERSLKALGVERIALYQLHAVDPRVPIEESVGELARLREEGKIEAIGLSNVNAQEIDRAMRVAPIVSVQNRFHVRDRRFAIGNGALRRCEELGLAFLAYAPVGGTHGRRLISEDPALRAVAQKHGATPEEVALAWLLRQSPCVVPIPGASRLSSIESSVRSLSLVLDAEDLARIG